MLQQVQIFHFSPTGSFGTVSGINLFHCLSLVISGIPHTISAEPFLIFLIDKIIFLFAVMQSIICFAYSEMFFVGFHTSSTVFTLLWELACFNKANGLQNIL